MAVACSVATGFEVGVLITILVALWRFEVQPLFLEPYMEEPRLEEAHVDPELRTAAAHSFRLGGSSPTPLQPVALPLSPLLLPRVQPPQWAPAPG